MLLACFTPILICFIHTSCTFYAFSGTNLLTRCRSASSCFLLFLVSEKLHRIYSRNWTWQKPKFLFLPCQSRSPKERRRWVPGWPHLPLARPAPSLRLGVVWAPWASPELASPPIYSSSRENPKHPSHIPRKVLSWPPTPNPSREGSEALPGTLPEREIVTGGFFITMPASEVMHE